MDIPIVTPELAGRIETAERDAHHSRMRGIGSVPGNPLAVEIAHFGQALAFIVRGSPYLELHRVIGLGSADLGHLPDLLAWWQERGVRPIVDLSPYTAGENLLRALSRAGLAQVKFLSVLYGQPSAEPPVLPVGVTVRELPPGGLDEFAAQSAAIDGIPPVDQPLWTEVIRAQFQDWRCYLAMVGGRVAAHGALHIQGSVAVTMYAATHPDFRNSGCQTALLRQRIADAAAAGCDLLVCSAYPTTSSQRNQERAGMRLAYTKAIWGPAPSS